MPKPRTSWFLRLQDSVISLLDETIFFRSEGREATRLHHFFHFCVLVGKSFVSNHGPLRATALAYTTMLALVPMLAVGLGVSTWVLQGEGGEEAIKEFVAKIVDETAPQLGLMAGDTNGPATIVGEDIRDLPAFITLLRTETNQVARYLWEQFPPATRDRLAAFEDPAANRKDLKALLAGELNRLIHSGALYDEKVFTNTPLTKATLALVSAQPQPEGEKLVHLNRTLLEEALPQNLARSAGADARLMVKDRIQSFISNVHSGALGITGTIGLIFIAVGLLSNIEATFNDIWGVKRGRRWHHRVFQYWGVLTLGPLLLVLAMGLSISGQVAKTQHVIQQNLPVIGDWVIVGMVSLAPFLITWIVFSLLYMMIPNTRVHWNAASLGGLMACALWHLNNYINVTFASRVVTASKIYGPLSALPVFLIGLYFSWLILLFGAQVAYTFQFRRAYLLERQTENINQRGREFVALRMAACIGEKFQEGRKAPTAAEIAENLGVPVRLVHQVGEALLASNLVTRVASEEVAYLPGRPLERITVHDVLLAMRSGQGQQLATLESPARSLVRGEYERIEEAERRVASSVNLLDVVNRLPRAVEVLPASLEDAKVLPTARANPPKAGPIEPTPAPSTLHPVEAALPDEASSATPSTPGEHSEARPTQTGARTTGSEASVKPAATANFAASNLPSATAKPEDPKIRDARSATENPAASIGSESFPL